MLVLFDIDGTLVRRTGPYHLQALIEGMRRVIGAEVSTDGIPVHGMLDPAIIAMMLQRAGFPENDFPLVIPEICDIAENAYLNTVPDLRDKTCPGVPQLLTTLSESGATLMLVTGNLTRIGWKKLECAGVHHYFRWGAFGEMAPTRGGLAALAIAHARQLGLATAATPITLIGDTPNDVLAARENGIRAVGVRTGITPPGELEQAMPDVLLDDLTAADLPLFQ